MDVFRFPDFPNKKVITKKESISAKKGKGSTECLIVILRDLEIF